MARPQLLALITKTSGVNGAQRSVSDAVVNLYQPGTTTPITVYNARTGGATVSPPFTTDTSGLVVHSSADELFPSASQDVRVVATQSGDTWDFIVPAVSGEDIASGAEVVVLEAATINVKFPEHGGVGDGVVDDTAAIQSALDAAEAAGGGRVTGVPGDTYLISDSGNTRTFPSVGATNYPTGIEIPSNVTLDMTGCTLKLAAGDTDTIMVTNADDAGNDNIGLFGTIDGNDVELDNRSLVWFEGIDGFDLDVEVINTFYSGFNCVGSTNLRGNIRASDSVGAPITLGRPDHPVTHSQIGHIVSNNCLALELNVFNFPGNPFICVLEHSSIESISCTDAAAGVKFYDFDSVSVGSVTLLRCGRDDGTATANTSNGSPNLTSVVVTDGFFFNNYQLHGAGIPVGTKINSGEGTGTFVMNANATATATGVTIGGSSGNSGFKLQTGSTGANRLAKVGSVTAEDCDGAGLFIDTVTDCQVGRYSGEGNGTLGAFPDVWVDGTRNQIGQVVSRNAGVYGLLVRSTATRVLIGSIAVLDPNRLQSATAQMGVEVSGGDGHFGSVVVNDSTGYMLRGLNFATGSTSRFSVGYFRIEGFSSRAINVATTAPMAIRFATSTGGGAVATTGMVTVALGSLPSRGSASPLTFDQATEVISVTGTADITSITATHVGHIVTLVFTGTAATNGVVDGSNLKIAGNLAYTPDDTMQLVCDGTNWYEIGRSVN